MDARNTLPQQRYIYELELSYAFEQTEKEAVKVLPRPPMYELLYDSPFEAQMWMVFVQCVAACCSVLQRVVACCRGPAACTHVRGPLLLGLRSPDVDGIRTATRCNTLQHTATHCNTLHRTEKGGQGPAARTPYELLSTCLSKPTCGWYFGCVL